MTDAKDMTETYDELADLKKRADLMGLTYHHAIGVEKLSKLIADALEGDETTAVAKSKKSDSISALRKLRNEQTKLVRVIVYNNNINRKEAEGDFFTIRNGVVGTVTKYVPYGNEEGWHVPKALLDVIREKKYQIHVKDKSVQGVDTLRGRSVPEFTIKELPPLTEKELKDLATRQAMAGNID